MVSKDRRSFLRAAGGAAIISGCKSVFGGPLLQAQASSPNATDAVHVYVDSRRVISPVDRNLFGSFLEHLGRAIYEGISDPGSQLSDASGFRKDVIDEIRRIGEIGRAHV